MIDDNYASQIASARQVLFPATSGSRKNQDLKRRTIVSASLYNLLPQVDARRHPDIIDNIELFQQWAIQDQHHVNFAADIVDDGDLPDFDALRQTPTIFCSYHLGSYRLLVPYLISNGVDFTLLIDSKVASIQMDDFQEVVRNSIRHFNAAPNSCRIIDTVKSGLIFSMLREVKNNRCLLIFADGNRGVDSDRGDTDNHVLIDFLGQTIAARKGIAYISSLTGASITPLYTYRNRENLFTSNVRFAAPIRPASDCERKTYLQKATRHIYAVLQEALREHYEQWESWFYIEQSPVVAEVVARDCPLRQPAKKRDAEIQRASI